ncbi:MAG: T9SS type A sorting domain-containing protein [Bacteroidetes bacterium]|nr:T9SS type A sorting domain-containing protein [Bacteroidota bacterium]
MKRFYLLFGLLILGFYSFAQTHGRVIRMDSLQYVDSVDLVGGADEPAYYKYGDTVTFQGVVVFNPQYYAKSATSRKACWIVDTSLHEWGGLMIFIDPGGLSNYSGDLNQLNAETKFYENFIPGYTVKATGIMGRYNNNSQIYLMPIESEIVDIPSTIDTTHIVDPELLTIDVCEKNDGTGSMVTQWYTGEKYEGMMVRFDNVTVVDVSDRPGTGGARKFWSVQDVNGNKMQIDDNSGYYRNDANASANWCNDYIFQVPSEGTKLNYIQGIIEENGSYGYQINPLLPSDISVAAAAPFISQIVRDPVVASSSDDVIVKAVITDNDGSIVSANLYYSVGLGNMTFTQLTMTKGGDGKTYSATIPAQANDEYVNYWFKAIDNNGLYSNYPDSLATGSMYRVINGGITQISQIQETPLGNGASIWNGVDVDMDISGIVTATLDQLGNVGLQSGTDGWSGILLRAKTGDGLADLKLGDEVSIKHAQVVEEYDVTFLFNAGGANHTVLSSNNTLPAFIINSNLDSIAAGIFLHSEPFESMLLKFPDVYVVELNADDPTGNYGEWVIGIDTTNPVGLRVDDLSRFIEGNFNVDSLALNQHLDFIQGLLYYSFGNWKLTPRDKNDIAGYFTDTTTVGLKLLNNREINLKLYPNPGKDQLFIEGSINNASKLSIQMYDLTGKLLLEDKQHVHGDFLLNLKVDHLNTGLYFIEISADNQRGTITRFYKN